MGKDETGTEMSPRKVKKENIEEEENEEKPWTINSRSDLTPYFEEWDHRVNTVYFSEVPPVCKEEPCQLGIDEAGRGPVLGPMVYGIAYAPLSKKQLLVDLGCADSKSLTEEERDKIFDKACDVRDQLGWAVEAISPSVIANSMYRRSKTSLNEVSMLSAIGLVKRAIAEGVRVAEVYVDTVGKPEKYQARLESIFPGIQITVAKKADSTYPIVSAASICAKVSRDHAIRAWQFREISEPDTEFGSGYPNDPATKKWLSKNINPVFGFPKIVRFSWSTAETILNAQAVPVEWEDVEDAEKPGERKISQFFVRSPTKSASRIHQKQHAFFTERCLNNIGSL